MMVEFGTDYQEVRHENVEQQVPVFFKPDEFNVKIFPNQPIFDLEGIRGRVHSSSYTPEPGHSNFQPMMARLEEIFAKYQQSGKVVFEYDTRVFYGHLS